MDKIIERDIWAKAQITDVYADLLTEEELVEYINRVLLTKSGFVIIADYETTCWDGQYEYRYHDFMEGVVEADTLTDEELAYLANMAR